MTDHAVGLGFDETLEGGFAMAATDPYGGEKLGKARGSSLTLRNHITIASVDEFIADQDHRAVLHAQIDFAPLGTGIQCTPGIFQLFPQSDDPAVKLMVYACGFTAGGARYYLEGKKLIHEGEPLHTLLDQTTTLYTRLHAGSDATGPVVGAGVLRIGVPGVIELVASIRTTGATSVEQSARAIIAFGAFFFGELWESYAGHVSGREALLVQVLSSSRAVPSVRPPVTPRPRLALPAADLPDDATATVVVVGSGYGGGIAASRLARTGHKVIVLERGKEWRAGDFPTGPAEAALQLQVDGPSGRRGPRTGLFDLHNNAELDVLVGCGLGGTSLINANVSLEPAAEVFDDPRWPKALRDDRARLADSYARARAMLAPVPYPDDAPPLHKLQVLEREADALHRPFMRPPINVVFSDRINAGGVAQSACRLCGDCVTGSNYNAKTTVDMSFLPDAKAHGAELYTEVTVRWIEQAGDQFRVKWRWTEAHDDDALRTITADVVVLAAGTLGSTEILLRSAEHGLAVSPRVGHQLSANGDYVSFGYNKDTTVHAVGAGNRPLARIGPVGPTVTGMIGPRAGQSLPEQYIIQEAVIPGALADALPLAFTVAASAFGVNTATSKEARRQQAARALESLAAGRAGPYVGAVNHTQTFLTIGHDSGAGTMALVDDRLRISWPGVGGQPIYQEMQETTTAATAVTQGISIREPIWTDVFDDNMITVHPLGGCVMGDDAQHGVVNDRGQVFSGSSGTAVYHGLYVADGAVVPTSLGVNPLLTICALAERAMTLLIRDRGWTASRRAQGASRRSGRLDG
ncbi:MAG TPA: GMC oxidoreductase [Kofleriaceae bacterium]